MTPKRGTLYDAIYPRDLRFAEIACIRTRRTRAAPPSGGGPAIDGASDCLPDDAVGLALSGGGIRSATFCLGILQALAAGGLVRRVDFLSTVSGGGYIGGFLGALINRPEAFDKGGPIGVERAERELSDPASPSLKWLREHGRYMSPNGAGDELVAGAVFVRNWFAIHIVMVTMVLAVMGLAAGFRTVNVPLGGQPSGVWWSPYLAIAAAVLLLVSFPLGWGYWFIQRDKRISRTLSDHMGWTTALVVFITCVVVAWQSVLPADGSSDLQSWNVVVFRAAVFFALTSLLALVFWRLALWQASRQVAAEKERNCRSRLSQWLADSMVVGLAIAAFGVIDSFGLTLYNGIVTGPSFGAVLTGGSLVGALAGVIPVISKLVPMLTRGSTHERISLPRSVVAGSVAVLLLGGILVGLSAVTYAIGFAGRPPAAPTPTDVRERLMWLTLGASILSILFGLTLKFVNNSSHQALYGARLTRAYLGASNKRRYDDKDARKVSDPVEGDDIGWGQYAPFRNGGPLHIVNVTLNETISGESQVEQRDRRGIPMAIGPCGLSGSKRSHSLFKQEGDPPTSADPGSDRAVLPQGVSDWIKPVSGAGSDEFDLFFGSPPREHVVEALNLGTWVAISGAAFTTGLGAQTSLSLSLLLGIANVRLGYWWDSHVEPWARNPVRTKPDLAKQVGEVVNAVFPVQMHLVQEFTARFFGPHRRRWYLSDGGHFENTACYELIRRRVPFIIACDNGQDESFAFEDIANLVRKVRIDFCAEVRFLTREELNEHVDPSLHDAIGTLDDFRLPLADANERGLRRDFSKAHALLAWVYYEVGYEQGGRPGSVILFIKPSVTGDEPLDVLQYRHQNPAFPNESTMDQYFDEAQWESYRKLGAHIGYVLFGRATTGAAWCPALMRAPLEAVEPRGHTERAHESVGSSL